MMRRRRIEWLMCVLCLVMCAGCGEEEASPPDAGMGMDMAADLVSVEPDQVVADLGEMRPDGGEEMGSGVEMGVGSEEMGADMMEPVVDPWAPEVGVFGEPEHTLVLSAPADGRLYVADVQASYADVDWMTLDRLYIPAGHYAFIYLGNLPQRDASRPLVITNHGGQVRVGGLDHHYLFNIQGGSGWVLTGRYDPVSRTGHEEYVGHAGGRFAQSAGRYGIVIDDEYVRQSVSGLAVGARATRFMVEFVEIARVGFAGMLLKTDNQGDATMADVVLRENYIHDTISEGIYVGSTQQAPQHRIHDWHIYNNRILRTGTEAIQLGQLSGHTRVHHNVFGPSAIEWRSAFQGFQDFNFQIGLRAGHLEVWQNVFLGGAGSVLSIFAQERAGDDTSQNVGITFRDNVLFGHRWLVAYINPTVLPQMMYRFEGNHIGQARHDREQVYPADTNLQHLFRVASAEQPVRFERNTWDGAPSLTSRYAGSDGIGGATVGTGNVKQEPAPPEFVNSGYPAGHHPLDIEIWTPAATLGNQAAVSYPRGMIVMYRGAPYQCERELCLPSERPDMSPAAWRTLPMFADDVRIAPGSEYDGVGLVPPR